MGNKVNLAIQNQYVEFAKKDGEGNDIAESIKALQQGIEDVVAFDGVAKITHRSRPGQPETNTIDKHAPGFYKITSNIQGLSGIGMFYTLAEGSLTGVYIIDNQGNTYSGSASGSSINLSRLPLLKEYYENNTSWDTTPTEGSTKPVTSGGVYSFVKPIYIHPIVVDKNSGGYKIDFSLIILNNDPTPFTLSTLITYIKTVTPTETSRFPASGKYVSSQTSVALTHIFSGNGGSVKGYGFNSDDVVTSVDSLESALEGASVFDGVNRIN